MSSFTEYKKTFFANKMHFKILPPRFFHGATINDMFEEASKQISKLTGVCFFFNQRLIFLIDQENEGFDFDLNSHYQEFSKIKVATIQDKFLSQKKFFNDKLFAAEEAAIKLEMPVAYRYEKLIVILFDDSVWKHYLKHQLVKKGW
jgi:hypothetical protein